MSDLDESLPVTFDDDGGCFGCSAANPAGLRLTFRRRGEEVLAEHVVAEHFHGAPGVVHGGIVAALLDEISCAAATFTRGGHVMTGELTIRYRRPCPVATPLALSARVVADDHPRYLIIEAEVRGGDALLASSRGKFFRASGTAP